MSSVNQFYGAGSSQPRKVMSSSSSSSSSSAAAAAAASPVEHEPMNDALWWDDSDQSKLPPFLKSFPYFIQQPLVFLYRMLFTHSYKHFKILLACILIAETVLGVIIIKKVPYTEIDWVAYMEEVSGFLGGDWDYINLKGGTGPLVYPAGFVYLFSALYYITNLGENILLGQYLFLGLYVAFIAVLFIIHHKAKVCPPWVMILLCASRRIHSIFMLRLFNDCFAMFFLYICIWLAMSNRWTLSTIFFSFALSIKMNILLFAPALGILLLQRLGLWKTLWNLFIAFVIQVILGLPFLYWNWRNYLGRAFEFSRVFFYKWTVNWKFIEEEVFLSKPFALILLAAHVLTMLFFMNKMVRGGLFHLAIKVLKDGFGLSKKEAKESKDHLQPSNGYILVLFFLSNFAGIAFARSLHYQFYVWYYHTLPVLLYLSVLPVHMQIISLAAIELSWNVFPARDWSSFLLFSAHMLLLVCLALSKKLPFAHHHEERAEILSRAEKAQLSATKKQE